MSNRIEEIEVYNLAETFAEDIWNIVIAFPMIAKDTMGKQLIRSADSISANIAEGFGRYHYKDNKNFCYYSRGSIIETKSWLRKAFSRKLINESDYSTLLQKLETIHLKLNIYIKYIGKLEKQ